VVPRGQRWARLSGFWGVPPFLALVEPVAVAVHFQDMNMVGETVEHGINGEFKLKGEEP
jgi:hypothetical protein